MNDMQVTAYPFSSLFQPINVGRLPLKNRLVFSPVSTRFAALDGSVTSQLVDYHVARAKGGVGLQIVANAYVADLPGTGMLKIDKDHFVSGLNELAEAIKTSGSAAGIQINHPGRLAGQGPNDLTEKDIWAIVEQFAHAAQLAKQSGFDLVEIHGAHAYLIAQFLSPLINQRTDNWGGNLADRLRFAIEVSRAVREAVGKAFPVSFRFSGDEFVPGGFDLTEAMALGQALEETGMSVLHVSGGGPLSREWTGLPPGTQQGVLVPLAAKIKAEVGIPVITVGRIKEPEMVREILMSGQADLVALGRQLVADPDFPNKVLYGQQDTIRKCVGCMECRRRVVDMGLKLKCSINSAVGLEGRACSTWTRNQRKVMVVGGGPAGMEAACVLQSRGHQVTLWEAGDKLGGQLQLAKTPPFKGEWNYFIDFMEHELDRLGVKVLLNRVATSEEIRTEKPEVLIIATGSAPLNTTIPGQGEIELYTNREILAGYIPEGKAALVVGGGSVGCETADYLADHGIKVTLVELLDDIAQDMESNARKFLVTRLKENACQIYTSTCILALTTGSAKLSTRGGEPFSVPADFVVLATGVRPENSLLNELAQEPSGMKIYSIGDCLKIGKVLDAVHAGYWLGLAVE